jgi:hypothetical protein
MEIVFVEKEKLPAKGMALLTVPLPPAPPRMPTERMSVEYIAVDGSVIDITLITNHNERKVWNEKRDRLIKELDICKNWRM